MDGASCKIGRLVVLAEHRGKGRGAALLHAIEKAFPLAERFELFTGSASPDNIRLYERAGYRQFAAEPASRTYCLVYLEKDGGASKRQLSLGVDYAGIADYKDYRDFWKRLPRVEARMVEQHEDCRHSLGEVIMFDRQLRGTHRHLPRPLPRLSARSVEALPRLSLMDEEDRSAYRLHCPDARARCGSSGQISAKAWSKWKLGEPRFSLCFSQVEQGEAICKHGKPCEKRRYDNGSEWTNSI